MQFETHVDTRRFLRLKLKCGCTSKLFLSFALTFKWRPCRKYNSNVHRGVHYLSGKATDAYEAGAYTRPLFIST